MTGSQPRRTPKQRLRSSVVRRTTANGPGAYLVRRYPTAGAVLAGNAPSATAPYAIYQPAAQMSDSGVFQDAADTVSAYTATGVLLFVDENPHQSSDVSDYEMQASTKWATGASPHAEVISNVFYLDFTGLDPADIDPGTFLGWGLNADVVVDGPANVRAKLLRVPDADVTVTGTTVVWATSEGQPPDPSTLNGYDEILDFNVLGTAGTVPLGTLTLLDLATSAGAFTWVMTDHVFDVEAPRPGAEPGGGWFYLAAIHVTAVGIFE